MSKLRKIMAIVMICVMAISVAGISVMASEEEWITVELDGTKKVVEIEWNLEQDMWHWFEINNKGDDKIKFAIIGTNDQVLPEGVASPGMGIGIGNKSGSEPLPAGKYTMKIESLGESNLKGDFKYKLSVNKPTNDAGAGTGNVVLVPMENDVIRVEDAQDVVFIANPDTVAMGKLHSYGIVEGDPDGDFRPYSTITRAEMAKVLSKMRGLNPNAPEVPTFSDVNASHWAYSYIECINAEGIIEGNGDGTFSPEANILFKDVVKMIVSAMGYAPQAEQKGGYPHGYAMVANQLGVTKDIDHALDVECVRNTVFKMLYNAMDVPFMVQTGFGTNAEYQIADGKEGRDHITFRERITGTPATYTQEYFDELKKFMEGGEYYDEIAAELEEFWKPNGFNGTYRFDIVLAELNDDATQISLKIKVTPDNGEICYLHLGYAKVDGEWQF